MISKIALGSNIYLFCDEGSRAGKLLISSHGEYMNRPEFGRQTGLIRNIPGFGGWFSVPQWTKLSFFSVHRTTLVDPGIDQFLLDSFVPVETALPGEVIRNYKLSKYQGRHNQKDEDYSSILSFMELNRNVSASRRRWAARKMNVQQVSTIDVLTIRNRFHNDGVHLLDVLRTLECHGRRYGEILCAFCRAPYFGMGAPIRSEHPIPR
ncbi:putative adhesin [Burkholderia ubonensis]|uniref:putative adhesin n=1 Tax=Burkholderia ubonensis TaxID=101571 RepID=UPI000B072E48